VRSTMPAAWVISGSYRSCTKLVLIFASKRMCVIELSVSLCLLNLLMLILAFPQLGDTPLDVATILDQSRCCDLLRKLTVRLSPSLHLTYFCLFRVEFHGSLSIIKSSRSQTITPKTSIQTSVPSLLRLWPAIGSSRVR
jgi:hypothetical protein